MTADTYADEMSACTGRRLDYKVIPFELEAAAIESRCGLQQSPFMRTSFL